MSDGYNKVQLLGNLGADPELRSTNSGESVLKLRLATSERYLDKNKTWQERTEWHSVTVWGKRAEALHRILAKGSNLFVEGSLRTTSYEKDGQKVYRTEVVAKEVILTGKRAVDDAQGQRQQRGHSSGGSSGQGDPADQFNQDDYPF